MHRSNFLRLLGTAILAQSVARAADPAPLQLLHTIPLPEVKGRFDHFACDPVTRRLAVAALGNDTGEVFDVAAFRHLRTIHGLHKPTGTLLLHDPGRILFANGSDGSLRSFDATSFAQVAELGSLDDADNVRLDPIRRLIYVGYGDGALAVVDPGGKQALRHIALAAHPESFQLETQGPRIFVNVPEKQHIAVIDREQGKVTTTWPTGSWQSNFPMALDEAAHRLFVGCRRPARLIVLNTETGAIVSDLEIAKDTDDLFFDAKRQRLYASCGEGFIDVIQRRDADHYAPLARIPTRSGARTCFFSPELDLLFLAVPAHSGQAAELRVYQPDHS